MKYDIIDFLLAVMLISAAIWILGSTFSRVAYAEDSISQKVLISADSYSHVREKTNHNDAPEITKFLKYVGLPPQLPWCLAFGVYNWGQVGIKNPYPKVGGTVYFMEFVKQHPLWYKVYTREDLLLGRGKEMIGGIGIYFHDARTGHAVLFRRALENAMFSTIEGNTIGVDSKSVAEQRGESGTKKQGVFYRTRSANRQSGFVFQGIVVPRNLIGKGK